MGRPFPRKPTPEALEMHRIGRQTDEWINSMIASGVGENAAVTAIFLTLLERALLAGGVDGALDWLRGMTATVEEKGPALLAELLKESS
jgi:hypothetical protein